MILFDLICDKSPVFEINILWFCTIVFGLIQMGSFDTIEFEVFSFENVAVFHLFVIKLVNKSDVLFFSFLL